LLFLEVFSCFFCSFSSFCESFFISVFLVVIFFVSSAFFFWLDVFLVVAFLVVFRVSFFSTSFLGSLSLLFEFLTIEELVFS
jgi:hypothetical protein